MRVWSLPGRLVAVILGFILVVGALWGGLRVERPVHFEGGPLVQGAWGSEEGMFGRGAGRDGLTYGPHSFALDDSGRIYVLDWANQRLQRFDAKGKLVNLLPLVGANDASLQGAIDLAVGPKDSMWLIDNLRGRLAYFAPDGKIHELRLFGATEGALLERADQVAATPQGAVWSQAVITTGAAIYQVNRVGGYGEAPTQVFRAALDKTGKSGPLPTAMAVSGDGLTLLMPVPGEPGAALVQRLSLGGQATASWKAPAWPDAAMNRPAELLGVDGKGNTYLGTWVKDALHVRVFNDTGALLVHTQVPAPRSALSHIYARVDGAGNLYVAGLSDAGYQVARYKPIAGWRIRPRWAKS